MAAMTRPEKMTRTTVDTIEFTRAECEAWVVPFGVRGHEDIQRPLKINAAVKALAEVIKADGGVLPGVLTLAKIPHDKTTYLLDGQHRRAAFLLSEAPVGFADVRTHAFDEYSDMGAEFVALNSQLVRLKPDDVLRGMEGSCAPLKYIHDKCPFVGYSNIGHGERSPVISMSTLIRLWEGSRPETPKSSTQPALRTLQSMSMDEAKACARFASICFSAWGRSEDTRRMWNGLNVIMCAWLYRRLVLAPPIATKRFIKIHDAEFEQCLMSVGASDKYAAWLVGRTLGERHRAPAYQRVKEIFAHRMMTERRLTTKPLLPQPGWSTGHNRSATV